MVTVYRLELPWDGLGVFAAGLVFDGSARSNRPMPFFDGIAAVSTRPGNAFGWYDWQHARAWFPDRDELEHLDRQGAQLNVYRVPELVARGGTQCVFNKYDAEIVASYPPVYIADYCSHAELPHE